MRYVVEKLKWLCCHVSYTIRLLRHPKERVTPINSYLARIKGMLPCPNPNGIIFFACDTQFMERFGYSLLFSCYEHARACGVHIHLYEPSVAVLRKMTALGVQFPDMRVSYTYEEAIDRGSLPELWVYYTAFRFIVAKKILEESKSVLLCLDADGLVQRSLSPVLTKARFHDIGLYFRLQKRDIRKKIAAFCVTFNYTRHGLAFLEFFAGLLSQFHQHYPAIRPELHFHFDQSCLYFSYLVNKFTKGLSFYRIGKEVVDYQAATPSCIWTAKGKRKEDELFLQEVGRIREKYEAMHPESPAVAKLQ